MNRDLYKDEAKKLFDTFFESGEARTAWALTYQHLVQHRIHEHDGHLVVEFEVRTPEGNLHSHDDMPALVSWYGPNMWTASWYREGKRHRSRKDKYHEPAKIVHRFDDEEIESYWQRGSHVPYAKLKLRPAA